MIRKGANVQLVAMDKRLKNIKRIKHGSVGVVIGTRKLPEDPEQMLLVKWQGKAWPVAVRKSHVTLLQE